MKILITALLFWLPSLVLAENFVLTWPAYPVGHKIQAECQREAESYAPVGEVASNINTLQFARIMEPGQTLRCKIRALRLADNAVSGYTPEVVYRHPLGPVMVPEGLTIELAP